MGKFKNKKQIDRIKGQLQIPVSIFDDRRLGVLECLVRHLREEVGMKNTEVAKLLNRDDRTIWTVYNRVKQKTAPKVQKVGVKEIGKLITGWGKRK